MVDFLRRQMYALRQSAKLCSLVIVAMLATVVINGVVVGYLAAAYVELETEGESAEMTVFLYGSLAGIVSSIAIVGFGITHSLFKSMRGGVGIAESLGGKLVSEMPPTPALQRLKNVTEEMAIAYSLPMPALYVLDGQKGINAFAAGFTKETAVIGVTEGCMNLLNRDQLQGVIAHEFSHIRYGDMRLNMQLTSIVNGLRCITLVGDFLIDLGRTELEMNRRGHHSRDKKAGGGYLLIILGCAMWVVGLVGSSFASLLVLAVSRQREFLADARAVEATRNPRGLADALRRIAGLQTGSRVRVGAAREVSHMMFSQACGRSSDIFATHPPLTTRILALDPTWDHTPLFESHEELAEYSGAYGEAVASIGGLGLAAVTNEPARHGGAIQGNSQPSALHSAAATPEAVSVDDIDAALLQFIAEPQVIPIALPMLLFYDHSHRTKLSQMLSCRNSEDIAEALHRLLETKDSRTRAALLSHALAALKSSSAQTKQLMLGMVQKLDVESAESDWGAFSWLWLVKYYLGAVDVPNQKASCGDVHLLKEPILEILSAASQLDGGDAMAEFRFQRGWSQLGLEQASSLPADVLHWSEILEAMRTLSKASPRIKRDLLVCLSCVFTGDGGLSHNETAFLRVVRLHFGAEDLAIAPSQTPAKVRPAVAVSS